jgi:cysteine-S-conjugate beta-lyase
MTFDFDQLITRRGSGCYKWDLSDDPQSLPMWVADMDFMAAPCVIEALHQRVSHGVFGYTKVPQRYFDALSRWFERRYDFPVKPEWVIPTSGVVPAISAILKAVTQPGDNVIVQTPVYNCFFSSIRNMECHALENSLIEQDGYYLMDFDDFEAKASMPDTTAFILCNPHNPVGRVWTADELRQIGDICLRHDVVVISDEIHCDLGFPEGAQHQPFATLSEKFLMNSITTNSPSKSFNIAGLHIANIIIANSELRAKVNRAVNIHEICEVNSFGVEALIAAYEQGEDWLDELRTYLLGNYQTTVEFISQHLPQIKVTRQEATYLAWLDCRELGLTCDELDEKLRLTGHLILNKGTLYGPDGEGFMRLNMACPKSRLLDGLERLKASLLVD